MKKTTPFRFSANLIALWLLCLTAAAQNAQLPWLNLATSGAAIVPTGPSTTKPTFNPNNLCLPEDLTVKFDYSGGAISASTTVKVQVGNNDFSTIYYTQDVTFTTNGSGNKNNQSATLTNLITVSGIVGNDRRVRILDASSNVISSEPSDQFNIGVSPTLTATSQSVAVCSGTNATIQLTGLITQNNTVKYKIGSGSEMTLNDVTTFSGGATLSVPVTAADNGQTLTITEIINKKGKNCTLTPSSNNTVTLQVKPQPTATVSGGGTVCSTDALPSVSVTLTGTGPWSFTLSDGATSTPVNNTSTNPYVLTNAPAGTYTVSGLSDANCNNGTASGSAIVTVNPAATASAITLGASEICQGGSVSVSATFGGGATSGYFDDSGACGIFSTSTNGSTVSGTYTPDPNFTGTATITFYTNDPDGPCPQASSSTSLIVNPTPTISFEATTNFGSEVTLTSGETTSGNITICTTSTPGLTLSNFSRLDNSVGVLVQTTAVTGSPTYNGNGIATGAPTDLGTGSGLTTFMSGQYGPYGGTGTLTQTYTPYYDANNDGDYDAGIDCLGSVLTLNYTIQGSSLDTFTGAPSSSICARQSVTLTVTTNGCFAPGTTFTVLLSDASGNFSPGTSLGNITPGTPKAFTLPASLVTGSGYKLRVINSSDGQKLESGAFQVYALTATTTTPSSVCQGASLPVTFTIGNSCPFPDDNVFTVQLSNAVGSFANPTVLGTATPGTTGFLLSPTLPVGTGYRVRIVSSNPAINFSASAPFQVKAPSLAVTPTVGGAPVCRGSQVTVNFNLPAGSCPFPDGNVFTAQLSSSTGSFNNPTNLGSVTPGQSAVTIPASVAAGNGYRIRVVSSSPAQTSSNSAAFQVKTCPVRLSAEEPALVVNPNPVVGGEIRCRVTGMDNPTFGLTTTTGRSLSLTSKTDGSGEFVLTPRQRLTAGVYVLQASEGTTRLTRRVLVTE